MFVIEQHRFPESTDIVHEEYGLKRERMIGEVFEVGPYDLTCNRLECLLSKKAPALEQKQHACRKIILVVVDPSAEILENLVSMKNFEVLTVIGKLRKAHRVSNFQLLCQTAGAPSCVALLPLCHPH
jgi:hypothetical protein